MAFPNLLRKLFSDGGKGAKLRPEIVPDIEKPGTIKFWYGEAQNVPTGWAICDGTNGTPDLRDLVIVGAGKSYRLGEKFGSASVLPKVTAGTGKTGISVEQVTASVSVGGAKTGISIQNAALNVWTGASGTGIGIQGTTPSTATMAAHNHGWTGNLGTGWPKNAESNGATAGSDLSYVKVTKIDTQGGNAAHAHGVSDPGHTHSIGSNPHGHGITDPWHTHTVTTPAHGHGITDAGHSHTITTETVSTLQPACAVYVIIKL